MVYLIITASMTPSAHRNITITAKLEFLHEVDVTNVCPSLWSQSHQAVKNFSFNLHVCILLGWFSKEHWFLRLPSRRKSEIMFSVILRLSEQKDKDLKEYTFYFKQVILCYVFGLFLVLCLSKRTNVILYFLYLYFTNIVITMN